MIIYQTWFSFSPLIENNVWVYQHRCNRALFIGYLIIRTRRLGTQVDVLLKEETDASAAGKNENPILKNYL